MNTIPKTPKADRDLVNHRLPLIKKVAQQYCQSDISTERIKKIYTAYYITSLWINSPDESMELCLELNQSLNFPLDSSELNKCLGTITKPYTITDDKLCKDYLGIFKKEGTHLGFFKGEKRKTEIEAKKEQKIKELNYIHDLDNMGLTQKAIVEVLSKQGIFYTQSTISKKLRQPADKIPWERDHEPIPVPSKKHNEKKRIKLNKEQKSAMDLILSKTKTRILLLGPAGTGKSYLLKRIKEKLEKQNIHYCVATPTGLSAYILQGNTIHSLCNIYNLHEDLFVKDCVPSNTILQSEFIFIDEISMIAPDLLFYLMQMIKVAEKRTGTDKYVIFSGDYFQLPPVCKELRQFPVELRHDKDILTKHNFYKYNFLYPSFFCDKTEVYVINLTKIVRQRTDAKFSELLMQMCHEGQFNSNINNILKNINNDTYSICTRLTTDPHSIYITAKKDIANSINEKCLEMLEGEYKEYSAINTNNINPDSLPVPPKLRLKIGAKVMIKINDQNKKYVNGTIAIVTKLYKNSIEVQCLDSQEKIKIKPHKFIPRANELENSLSTTNRSTSHYTQLPIICAYALTTHMIQGQTYSNTIIINPNGLFESGQLYTMLSRATSSDNIILTRKLRNEDWFIDQPIIDFYNYYTKNATIYTPELAQALASDYKDK